jgi:hypothetical protein
MREKQVGQSAPNPDDRPHLRRVPDSVLVLLVLSLNAPSRVFTKATFSYRIPLAEFHRRLEKIQNRHGDAELRDYYGRYAERLRDHAVSRDMPSRGMPRGIINSCSGFSSAA